MDMGIIIIIIFYTAILFLAILILISYILYISNKYKRKKNAEYYFSVYKIVNVKKIKIKRYTTYMLFFKPMITINNESEINSVQINFLEYNNIIKNNCKICTIKYMVNNRGNKDCKFISAE